MLWLYDQVDRMPGAYLVVSALTWTLAAGTITVIARHELRRLWWRWRGWKRSRRSQRGHGSPGLLALVAVGLLVFGPALVGLISTGLAWRRWGAWPAVPIGVAGTVLVYVVIERVAAWLR